ncbi:mucin-4-like isoform X8 [Anser cygnoides]|uniref:mucin-4-like isoform X8 n=1 Tax=Anser cygnoides TaxID=8845 RepID=UPI0034D2AFA6
MGTRGWTLPAFVGCCLWILHGLGAAVAVPVTTEGPFGAHTASPTAAPSEARGALPLGAAGTSTAVADTETTESILAGRPASPSFPSGAKADLVTTTSAPTSAPAAGSDAEAGLSPSAATQAPSGEPQAVTDVATSLNASQGNQTVSAAALVFTPQPAFTPSAELDVTAAAPAAPPGATPLFADMSKDILASVTREGADLEPTADATSLPATLPPAATGAEPTTSSPLGPHVTALLSQGQATATGAAEEGVTLPGDSQGEGSAPSSIPSPGAGGLLTTRWDEVLSGTVGVTPGPALGSGNAGDAVNGAVGTTDSSHLAPENGTVSGAAENPGQTSLLAGQAGLSPATSPGPAGGGDGDVQGAPAVSPASPGSVPAPAAPEAPGERGDTATLLLASRAPTDAQSDTDAPAPSITLPLPTGAVGPAEPSLQPAPWHSPTGERQPQLAAALPSPTDTPSAPGAAFPPPGAAAGDGAETTANPDLGAAPGAPASLSPGGSQPWGTAAAAPEGADGAGTVPNSALDAASLASSGPNGLAGPAQGDTADTAQAGGTGDSSPYAGTQGDTSSSSSSAQQGPADTAELPAAPAGALPSTELSPAAAPGDGAGTAPAPEEVSPPGPMAPGHVGLEPDLSGAEGPGPLPSQAPGAPSAAFPPPVAASGAVFGTSNGAEMAASPDLGAAQGAPISPFLVGSQPWGMAAGAPTGAALPGAEGPGTGFSSTLDAPGSASHGSVGPPSPTLGVQPGADLGVPGAEGQVLGGSRTGSEPSLSSSPGAGMEAGTHLLPGAVSLPGPASPGDTLPISSTSENGAAAAPMPAAAPGPDRLSQGSPDSETGPELATAQGTKSAGDMAEAANPGSRSPYTDTSSLSSSAQQGPADTTELPAAPAGALPSTELSPAAAPGDGAGAAPAPAEVSPPGPMAPGYVGLEPDLSGAEGLGPSQAPGVAFPPPVAASGAAFGTSDGAETAANPNLGAAQGAPISPFLVGSQPWGMAGGAPTGAALPGAEGPGTGFSSALDAPGSASHGPVGPPSPTLGVQPGADLGVPGTEGQALGGSGTGSEPSLSSSPGAGMEAGTDLLPGAVSLPGPASPGDTLTAPSVLDSASPGALGGVDAAPSAVQPALGAGPGAHPPAGGGGGEGAGAGNGESPGVSQDLDGAAGASGGGTGAVLHSASPSPSPEGSSSAPTSGGAAEGAGGPGAGGAGVGLSPDPEAAGPQGNEETPVPAPGIQSGADLGLSDANLSQTNVVQLAGGETGASAPWAPAPGAGTADGAGAIIQITSGVLAPSVLSSPREVQPLVPVAPDASSPLLAASAGGVGGSSAPAPSGGPPSASGTPSGSSPLALGSPLAAVVAGAGSALPGSPEYEMSSGMAAPLGEESPRAPAPANAAPALPPASEREDAAAGAAAGPPPVSSPVSGTPPRSAAAAPVPPPGPTVAAVSLYGYGPRENDREYVERRVDFNSPLFKPETGFPFGKTLRDSLYFTDNGQIIFPASDSSIPAYPNPPPGGFNGHEEVPMIAVFWDNADFSRGTGTTFYQEFLTLNSEKPPFIRDVEAKVRRYLRSSYSAAWTLKVTWDKAPAYGVRGDSRRTNTYQAVLTTDGFRSYVLLLYQDGGMRWDYSQLPAANVLIGYTSGDGSYHNDDLTQGPPAAKYRPDQFRGYNTDLRGLWLYKLESRVGINYRLKCLAWTGQQQEPRTWSQDLPACPCSLQQGQQDPRFKSSRGGWWSARVSMLHSASPNRYGAGVRCLYDSRGQFVEGRQERYWRSSRQASPYRDQELKLYDWCCNQAASARLCARYGEKRPRIGCDGYQALGMGGSPAPVCWGDAASATKQGTSQPPPVNARRALGRSDGEADSSEDNDSEEQRGRRWPSSHHFFADEEDE